MPEYTPDNNLHGELSLYSLVEARYLLSNSRAVVVYISQMENEHAIQRRRPLRTLVNTITMIRTKNASSLSPNVTSAYWSAVVLLRAANSLFTSCLPQGDLSATSFEVTHLSYTGQGRESASTSSKTMEAGRSA